MEKEEELESTKKGGEGKWVVNKTKQSILFQLFSLVFIDYSSVYPPTQYLLSNCMLSWSPPSSWLKLGSRVNFKSFFSFKKYAYVA